MGQNFPWKRFWCRRENTFSLGDQGFLSDPDALHGELLNPNLTTFEQLQQIPFLAMLGEPGVGKSWSLAADLDVYLQRFPATAKLRLDLRNFGSEDRLFRTLFESETFVSWVRGDAELYLYLDSLDECLLRIDSVAALLSDEISKYPVERLKLRIACRTASWPGLLENGLGKRFGEHNFAAVELAPLRRKDVIQAATLSSVVKPKAFLTRVDELGLAPFAGKPITLKMLIDTFRRDGDLPSNALDLYEKGCSILCEEQNDSRLASRKFGSLSAHARVSVASRIAAGTQLGNRFAVWTGTEAAGIPKEDIAVAELADENKPLPDAFDVSTDAILETLDTGLFSSRGLHRLGWAHQTFAEYLAARYCIQHQLPLAQLRSFVFHPRRGRVVPQVREVASWIALQHPGLFAEIAALDPGVLLGSASPSLSDKQRSVVLQALIRRSDKGELLHMEHNLEFANLAHAAIADELRPVIVDNSRLLTTRYLTVLIARACRTDALGDDLVSLMLADSEDRELRIAAGHAIADFGNEQQRDRLRPLLVTTREADPDDQLRGVALQSVYPGDTYDEAMWNYLVDPRRELFFGAYNNFLSYGVIPKLNGDSLPSALRWCSKQQHDIWER